MNVPLKGLALGDWRDLTPKEIDTIVALTEQSEAVPEKKGKPARPNYNGRSNPGKASSSAQKGRQKSAKVGANANGAAAKGKKAASGKAAKGSVTPGPKGSAPGKPNAKGKPSFKGKPGAKAKSAMGKAGPKPTGKGRVGRGKPAPSGKPASRRK
jgi:23S rRNA pseudouridine2604 synthase